MAEIFKDDTRVGTWMKAAEHLLLRCDQHIDYNLVLEIQRPAFGTPVSRQQEQLMDQFLIRHGMYPLNTVAETIFPGWEYVKNGAKGVFEIYPDEIYPKVKSQWGTYAYRLVRRQAAGGKIINPLEQCIEKLVNEREQPGPKRACYEIGVCEGAHDIPLYDTATDLKRRLGGPCLSHLSFKLGLKGELYLTAMYRSHYYVERVLGNLLGLARLQSFVAKEAGLEVGPLTVLSTYARLEVGINEFRDLLRELKGQAHGTIIAA